MPWPYLKRVVKSWLSKFACLMIVLVIAFIFLGIPTIFIIRALEYRNPTFTLEEASVTGFNLTRDGRLTCLFDVTLQAYNRNRRIKLKYTRVRVSIFKSGQTLATDALPKFTQRKRNVTLLRAEPVALNVSLKKGPAFDLEFERGMGYIDIGVGMTATMNNCDLIVACDATVNLTAPAVVAAAPSSDVDNNGLNSQSARQCGVGVYCDDNND